MVEPPEDFQDPIHEAGPDPVWGVGLCIVGLLIMATGGAATWHWVFNVGEGILLVGMVVFIATVVLSWNAQRKLAEGLAVGPGGAAGGPQAGAGKAKKSARKAKKAAPDESAAEAPSSSDASA